MDGVIAEHNQGELKVTFEKLAFGKLSLADLGFKKEDLAVEGGNLRMVIDIGQIGKVHFFKVPTLEFAYNEKIGESEWIVEYNGDTLVDKIDHSGHATLILLDRKVLDAHTHHHENRLIVHADLPAEIHLDPDKSFINLLEKPGS